MSPIWIAVAVVAALAAAVAFIAFVFSTLVLHAHRQPIVRTPSDYSMEFEEVAFASTDGLQLKGWFIPAAGVSDRAIILTHPFPFNRHGFTPKNQGFPPLSTVAVDLLKTARALHAAGYPLLMFDFRNHGESASGVTGVGLTEFQDVLGALDYLRGRPDLREPRLGFVSFCMGANATIIALSKGAQQARDVCFLVAIQPVSAAVFVRQYLKAQYTPLSLPLASIVDWIDKRRGGFALSEMSPLPYAKSIRVPILYVQARRDRWTTTADTQSFYDAAPGEKEIWWIEEVSHRFKAYDYVGEHPERVLDFIRKHF
jgi:pimeloyl-ACP methyl ester carboxylesterase